MVRHTVWGSRWRIAATAAVLLVMAASAALADPPCTKLPDLWFPAPGVILSGGDLSVQVADPVVVMQGGIVTITVTVDNFTCGETGPFDVSLYYDTLSPATLIATQTTSLLGCEHVVLIFTWDTTGVPDGPHTVCVWADSGEVVDEYKEDDNTYCFDITVLAAPVIEVEKTFVDADGGCHEPEDTLLFTLRIGNVGDGDHTTTLSLRDELPAELLYVAGSLAASTGVASYDPIAHAIEWTGTLAAGTEAVITFEVEIDAATPTPSDVANQAFVDWDPDQDGTKDAQEPSDDPATPASDDPTVVSVQDCSVPLGPPIPGTIDAPSLTEWGMIASGIAIGLAFALMLLRRRSLLAAGDARGRPA
jgi:hypothetical protein